MSELYQRKVTRARQSLNEADSVRSIVKSLRENSLKHQLTMSSKMEQGRWPAVTIPWRLQLACPLPSYSYLLSGPGVNTA